MVYYYAHNEAGEITGAYCATSDGFLPSLRPGDTQVAASPELIEEMQRDMRAYRCDAGQLTRGKTPVTDRPKAVESIEERLAKLEARQNNQSASSNSPSTAAETSGARTH